MCIISQNGPAIGNVLIDAQWIQYRLLVSSVRRLRAKAGKETHAVYWYTI